MFGERAEFIGTTLAFRISKFENRNAERDSIRVGRREARFGIHKYVSAFVEEKTIIIDCGAFLLSIKAGLVTLLRQVSLDFVGHQMK